MELSSVSSFPSSLRTKNPTLSVPRYNRLKASSSYHKTINKPIKFSYFSSTQCYANNFQPPLVNKCSKSLSLPRKNSTRVYAHIKPHHDSDATIGLMKLGKALWRFMRPFVVLGVLTNSGALFAKELLHNPSLIGWPLLFKASSALFIFCSIIFSVSGLNQIYDMDIDRINKPDLPIISGELSLELVWLMTIVVTVGGFIATILLNSGPLFPCLYFGAILIGGYIYSAPPLRWKKNPFTSLFCNLVLFCGQNFCVYYASRASLGLSYQWRPAFTFVFCVTSFMTVPLIISKDLSDVEGDRRFGITTFATKYGARTIAFFSIGLLLLNYVGATLAAILFHQVLNRNVILVSHAFLALCLLYQAWILKKSGYTEEAYLRYYRFIWKIYSAETIIYLLI